LKDLVERYLSLARDKPVTGTERQHAAQLKACWERIAAQEAPEKQRNQQYLGRYLIGQRLPAQEGTYEYRAYDTYPCKVPVHLKEFPFDPTLPVPQLQENLDDAAREMVTLRRIRHPHVGCVIGHFSTGASLVQVSDWFDGHALGESWNHLRDASLTQRIGLCCKLADALAFCHERSVFHRDLSDRSVLITPDLDQARLSGFRLARDLSRAGTLTSQELAARDQRLLAPEELAHGHSRNARLTDIYQAGVLFYRIMEGGEWPAESTYAVASGGPIRPMTFSGQEPIPALEQLLREMLATTPEHRPDLMRRVERRLWDVARL
jgi:serine/threonine protein kinase